ncbi:DsbA family protein [Neorickettsia findlayensis]|uniref:Thioredoxin domain-containing protein n=1 Tax=Neorickettsia findlayensis TaxID=2686014 RepID=A0A6P1GB13_9RICK|nr:DsbA family protein [Neorickettsia findlayensis]QHD65490.1 thioredoxin domain-containing protein [Neorickettsia findlayensis]
MRTFLLVLALVAIAGFPFVSNWYYGRVKDSYAVSQTEKIVEEYIQRNPEKILESVNQYRLAQFEEQQKQKEQETNKLIAQHKSEVFDANYPSFVAENAKTVLVEFFDASCGYCKLASQILLKIKRDYPNVTYTLRNLPILGQSSLVAAKYDTGVFLFMKEKDIQHLKYSDFHSRLMAHEGVYTPEVVTKILSEINLDPQEVLKFIEQNESEISSMIEATIQLAQKLRLDGTPVFIVGDKIVQGVSEAGLREMLEKVS